MFGSYKEEKGEEEEEEEEEEERGLFGKGRGLFNSKGSGGGLFDEVEGEEEEEEREEGGGKRRVSLPTTSREADVESSVSSKKGYLS